MLPTFSPAWASHCLAKWPPGQLLPLPLADLWALRNFRELWDLLRGLHRTPRRTRTKWACFVSFSDTPGHGPFKPYSVRPLSSEILQPKAASSPVFSVSPNLRKHSCSDKKTRRRHPRLSEPSSRRLWSRSVDSTALRLLAGSLPFRGFSKAPWEPLSSLHGM